MAKIDLRKRKDQATEANEKKKYAKAAELYVSIAEHEPDEPDWRQRAGEALRKLPDAAAAVVQLARAAEGYARNGFLLKAIAVCKVVLQLDPAHTATQTMLAGLYATRDGHAPAPPVRWAPPPVAPPRPPPAAVATAPLEILPLHAVLGGRKSQQFAAIAEAVAYEIALDQDLRGSTPARSSPPPVAATPRPAAATPRPAAATPLPTLADDDASFAGLLGALTPAPSPPLPSIPLLSSLSAADLRHVIERVALRELAPGDVIVREGDPGGSLFAVVTGSVDVTVAGPPARTLATLGEGAFFGELAILTDFPRSATVTATRPTQLIEISRALVGEIIARSPEVLRTLLRFFRDRLLDRLLGASPLFSSFDPEQARALAERFLFLELDPGVRVIALGERAPGLFLLLCGAARVLRDDAVLARLGPGDVFGEMSLLDRQPASVAIETLTKCWVLELPRAQFQEIMVTYPQMLDYVSDVAERRKRANLHVDFL